MVACETLTVRLYLYSLAEVIHTGVGLFGDAAVSFGGLWGGRQEHLMRHRARLGRFGYFGLSIGGLT